MSHSTASSPAARTTLTGWTGMLARPERLTLLLTCVVGIIQVAYFLIDINRGMNRFDEGVPVYGASRILNGDVPYRDFWMTGYGPGESYVLALLFRLFGPSIYVERLWDIAVRLAIGLVFYLIMRKMTTPLVAAVWWLLITAELLSPSFYYGYVTFPALLFYLLTILLLLRYFTDPQIKWVVLVGVTCSLVAVFRVDFGIYSLLTTSMALMLFAFAHPPADGQRMWNRVRNAIRVEGVYILTAVTCIGLAYLYFIINVPFQMLWSDLIDIPLKLFAWILWLPYPSLVPTSLAEARPWLGFYGPIIIFAVSGVALAVIYVRQRRARQPIDSLLPWFLVCLIPVGILLFNQALRRNDEVHRLPSHFPAFLLLGVLVYAGYKRYIYRMSSYIALAIFAIYLSISVIFQIAIVAQSGNPGCQAQLERSGCIYVNPDMRAAVNYIETHTAKDERIYVGNTHHDRALSNDIMFYFLSDRQSATPYHILVAGVITTRPVQEATIEGLKKYGVRYVVLVSTWDLSHEPNESSRSSGVTVLDDYIRNNYAWVAGFGNYTILQAPPTAGFGAGSAALSP